MGLPLRFAFRQRYLVFPALMVCLATDAGDLVIGLTG